MNNIYPTDLDLFSMSWGNESDNEDLVTALAQSTLNCPPPSPTDINEETTQIDCKSKIETRSYLTASRQASFDSINSTSGKVSYSLKPILTSTSAPSDLSTGLTDNSDSSVFDVEALKRAFTDFTCQVKAGTRTDRKRTMRYDISTASPITSSLPLNFGSSADNKVPLAQSHTVKRLCSQPTTPIENYQAPLLSKVSDEKMET